MKENTVSEAQRRATKKWEQENLERKRYLRHRSNARTFVRHWATEEDFKELEEIFRNSRKNN